MLMMLLESEFFHWPLSYTHTHTLSLKWQIINTWINLLFSKVNQKRLSISENSKFQKINNPVCCEKYKQTCLNKLWEKLKIKYSIPFKIQK